MTPNQASNRHQLFTAQAAPLAQTDPELVEYFDAFAFDEVAAHGNLDERTRLLVQLAALIAVQGRGAYRAVLGAALGNGVTPTEAKEIAYQAVAYLGMGKVYDFLVLTNEVLNELDVEQPLPPQSTTTPDTRFTAGWQAQAAIVGADRLKAMHEGARPDEAFIQTWLTENCFGDHYTRGGIDLVTRELLTFVLLVAHGGCDPQVRGHVAGNLRMGNDRTVLLDALSQLVPWIGYPRTLNGLAAVNEVAPAT